MAAKKNNALTWIVREAKRLKREYPHRFKKWNQYVAQASAIYSSKHAGKSPVGHKSKKTRMPRKVKKKARRTSGIATRSRTHTDYNRNKVNITVGAVRKDKMRARSKIEHLLGIEEVKLFKARLKRHKKKIQKRITALKADYRRLSA